MGKLQDFVRECIVNCKTSAEINTQSKAEVLLEKFAGHLDENGGGGGASSWNDLTDKPFGEETRTVIIPEVTMENFNRNDPLAGVPVAGARFIVNWNGTQYECIGQDLSAGTGTPTVAIGNFDKLSGAGDTGEPFVIMLYPEGDGEIYCEIYPLNPDDEQIPGSMFSFSVGMVETSKIPGYLLPEMPKGDMFVTVGVGSEPDIDFMSAIVAASTGQMVYMRIVTDAETAIIPLVSISHDGVLYFRGTNAIGETTVFAWTPDGIVTS